MSKARHPGLEKLRRMVDALAARAKASAPPPFLADVDKRSAKNLLGTTIISHMKGMAAGIDIRDLKAKKYTREIIKFATYKGALCPTCQTTTRERTTDKCMVCEGPATFRLALDQKRETQRRNEMLANECTRAVMSELAAYGFKGEIVHGGKHPKITWTDGAGKTHSMVVPKTPSDHRSHKNARAEVKRMLQGQPAADTTFNHYVTIGIRDAAIFQADFMFPKSVYVALGKPERVDVITLPNQIRIKKGDMVAVHQAHARYRVQISALKVGFPRKRASAVRLDTVNIENDALTISGIDAFLETIGNVPAEAEAQEGAEAAAPVLEQAAEQAPPSAPDEQAPETAQAQPPSEPELLAGLIHMSTVKNGASVACNLAVPHALLERIGKPSYVEISGDAYHGFKIAPRLYDGIMVNYKTSKAVYFSIGFKRVGLTKDLRKQIAVEAVVRKDGTAIDIEKPNFEWIRCAPIWRRNADVPPSIACLEGPTSYSNGNGTNGHAPEAVASAPGPTGIQTTRDLLEVALSDVRKFKDELERTTGLKFAITRDLKIVVV